MNKFIFSALIGTVVLTACNENKSTDTVAADAAVITVPAPAVVDTLTNILIVSDNEMKDDSVFKDGSIPTSWANAGITDVRGLKLFLKQAQQWVMNNEKQKLAAAIKYPLKSFKNEEELIAAYDTVFTKEVKLSFATINFNQIFRNQKGVMTEGGKVWINQFGKDFKIFAINN
ncbi:MAG: hypothetical protein EOO13_03785 [Chitinophagaceae bacterium]|nr:MAG: hypothetical protein EOO13_03785 [Chitinophagaceae bacterium]